jgi:hypothetical protein
VELERAVLTQQFSLAEDAAAREREAAAAQLATAEGALACTAGEKHAADRREVEVANGDRSPRLTRARA